jgi:predicted PurR-regulated permease PerM
MPENNNKMKMDISIGALLKVALVGGLIYAIVQLQSLILVILTSIVVASFVVYAVSKLKRFIKNRTLAVFLIYIIIISIIILLSSVFVPVFLDEMSTLVTQLGKYIPDNSIFNNFQASTITGAKNVVGTISKNASLGEVVKTIQNFSQTVSGGFFNVFGSTFGGLLNLFLVFIISFYLSITEGGIEGFLRIVTPDKHEEYVIGLWKRTERKIGLWLQGQMLVGLIIGLLTFLGLTLLGVKYALVLSLLSGLCTLIPFGIFVAMIIATLFAYIDGGIMMSLLTLGIYLIIHQFESYLISPLIVKKVTGIPPLIVILAVLIGADLAGIWGVILAIPAAVLLLEFTDELEKKKSLTKVN